jgi:exopolysaccharide biosynthesis predicted pyruvyltransferase EpsI
MAMLRSPLLPPDAFAHVFRPLLGKRIGYVRPLGNVGDAMIDWATRQLFRRFDIDWRPCDPYLEEGVEFDELVFGGGGNMGTRYRNNWELRGRALALGIPMTIFPQSFTSPEPRPYRRVYVREHGSLAFCPRAVLAPELALGLRHSVSRQPSHGVGVFLRRDPERAVTFPWFRRDPARLCRTPQEYLKLAASYEAIVTDRLHFAICGLLLGRKTILLPNDYHKNESVYETWLRSLGCGFMRDARSALRRAA